MSTPIKPIPKSFISRLVRSPSIVEGRISPSKHNGWTDSMHRSAQMSMAAKKKMQQAKDEGLGEPEVESDFEEEEA